MSTLTKDYQFIGRSSAVKAYGYYYYYYILLYAKTVGSTADGKHTVSVKMRLACDVDATFYGYFTSGSVSIDGKSAISWSNKQIPASYWGGSSSITAGGVTYPRWVELGEGTVVIDTAYEQKEIVIAADWQRLSINETPPNWLPSTTKATASIKVTLPEIAGKPVVPDEEDPVAPEPDDPEVPEPAPPATDVVYGTRIYADGVLAYDSRLEGYELVGLTVTTGLNVGGTAEIVMPHGHPAYSYFTSYKTTVTIYRDGVLRFRGRALYTVENFLGQRTVTCEGELCFLRDAINRPYLYTSSPAKIFRALIREYNSQVEGWKQFAIGAVTVVDSNDYLRMESESAEPILTSLNKLVERCGGYLVFYTTSTGSRAISWLASLDSHVSQDIEFGENLLDFTSTGANTTSLATGIVPYGARNAETKKRVTIESVNGGKDYIIAEDAQAIRGTIMTTAVWDDVTEPANLLKKAQEYLEEHKVFITSLTLTALDLSYIDKDLNAFVVGDTVRVLSAPHGVDEYFQLTQMTEDLLNPAQSSITLGKDIQSLTGADVAGDFAGKKEIEAVKVDYGMDIDKVTSSVEQSVLAQTANVYAPKGDLTALDERLSAEVSARAGVINKVDGVVHISGGAPINMLGGKIDINGSEINFGKEIGFNNESGIRIKDKDGNSYYVLRVDYQNKCFVGNDYTNLYLRGKDAVYLYKTGAAVTSDRREKNSIEALPEPYIAMLDKLTPVRFKYNGRGDRYHVGFTAQDVSAALQEAGLKHDDFGGFVDLNGDGSALGLAYDEFIGLLLEKIRRLENRIEALEE